jgi:hypothetical protein
VAKPQERLFTSRPIPTSRTTKMIQTTAMLFVHPGALSVTARRRADGARPPRSGELRTMPSPSWRIGSGRGTRSLCRLGLSECLGGHSSIMRPLRTIERSAAGTSRALASA